MKVLITGVNGFVGTHLSNFLLNQGFEITGLDFAAAEKPFMVLHADITSYEELTNALADQSFDYIVHLAAFASVGQSFKNPLKVHAINYQGTLNLLEIINRSHKLKSHLKKILYISSADIYENSDQPVNELSRVAATSPYTASKIAAEVLIEYYQKIENLPVIIARPFNHIGKGQSLDFFLPSVIEQFKKALQKGEKSLNLDVGNIDIVRDFHSVEDVCRAYGLLLEKGIPGEIYNIGSGKGYNLKDIIEMIAEISSVEVKISVDLSKYRPADKPVLICNAQKINRLGWKPVIEIEEILKNILYS